MNSTCGQQTLREKRRTCLYVLHDWHSLSALETSTGVGVLRIEVPLAITSPGTAATAHGFSSLWKQNRIFRHGYQKIAKLILRISLVLSRKGVIIQFWSPNADNPTALEVFYIGLRHWPLNNLSSIVKWHIGTSMSFFTYDLLWSYAYPSSHYGWNYLSLMFSTFHSGWKSGKVGVQLSVPAFVSDDLPSQGKKYKSQPEDIFIK